MNRKKLIKKKINMICTLINEKLIAGSMAAVGGISPMISAISVNPSKQTSPIYLLPRFPNEFGEEGRDWRVPVEAPSQFWLLHVGNAFEVKDLNANLHIQIQAVTCSYHWFNFPKVFGLYVISQ
jgi:9-cis-beta-carotene 9',10'-cleaving dioxygenase